MKKIMLFAALLIVLSVVVFAQDACPDLTPQIIECQRQSLDPKYEQNNGCKQVVGCCSNDYIAQDLACRTKGGDPVLGVDSNSCTFLRECKMSQTNQCPSLEKQKQDCQNTGYKVMDGTDWSGSCEYIRCRSCKTQEQINQEKTNCENSKGTFQQWEMNPGCYETSCMQTPSCDWTDREKERCRSNGGTPREVKPDNNYGGPSCPMIVCDYQAEAGYSSKDKCESSTNCFCEYRDCNYVMKGTSYEDTCGKNFFPGWYCQIPKPTDGIIKCGGSSGAYYCPQGYRCDSMDWNNEGKCVKEESQNRCYEWKEEEINREKQRCDKSGGKLEKREDPWMANNCNSYRCISQDNRCGSSSMPDGAAMLECPQGYYCEQPDYRGGYGYNYQQEYGKCLPIKGKEKCPVLDAKVKSDCSSKGGTPEIKKNDKGCEYYECKPNKDFCGGITGIPCPKGYYCKLDGNYPDAGGKCVKPELQECMKEEDVQASLNKCISNDGLPRIKSEQGCVKEVACLIKEKERELPPEEKKEYDLGRLFNVAFKLEELRIQFDKLKKKTQSIAEYYEKQNEPEYAAKFKTVSGLFDNLINEVDSTKADLRESIDKDATNEETLGNVKKAIQGLKNNMKEILKELLR